MYNTPPLDSRSLALRRTVIRMLEGGRRGHVGSGFSVIEVVRVLYDDILKFDAKRPQGEERDRFIFSKGHGCLGFYAILFDKGFFPESELAKFCKPDGILGGHPEVSKIPGVEASTGSLGHGLSLAVGRAIGARMNRAKHRVFALISDGECNEGSVWEAALCASKHKLSNLTVVLDYNKMQSYSSTKEVLDLEPLADKWKAFNFAVEEVDGHNVEQIRSTLKRAPFTQDKSSLIICHTIKGKGIPFAEQNPAWHHKNKVTDEEVVELYRALEEPQKR